MARFPALPLFVDSWTLDTRHLNHRQRGIYMDIIMLMWVTPNCRIPDDLGWIAARIGLTKTDPDLAQIVSEFCSKARGSGGKWLIQKRLLREFGYLSKKRVLRSRAAKCRWDKEKKDANAKLTPPHPTYKDSPLPPNGGKRSRRSLTPNGASAAPSKQLPSHASKNFTRAEALRFLEAHNAAAQAAKPKKPQL